MMQTARNLTDPVDVFLQEASHLVHDRDPIHTGALLEILIRYNLSDAKVPCEADGVQERGGDWAITRLKLVAVGVGAVMAWLGYQEFKLGGVASETPQTISCAELEASGPGDNAHVVMTDFLLLEQACVYESRENNPRWQKIWIPALPLGGEFHQQLLTLVDAEGNLPEGDLPLPRTMRVIVKSSKIQNEAQLGTVAGADTLQGLVINEIESLGSKERELLTESYPGIDFNTVWILEHERKPAGKGKTWGLLGGGTLLALLGLGAFFVNRD